MQTELYPNENRPCKRYNEGKDRNSILQDSSDFMKCGRKEIGKLLNYKTNCSIVGLEQFFDNPNEMSQCKTENEAKITFANYIMIFYDSYRMFWINTCNLPCIQVTQLRIVLKNHVFCLNIIY